MKIKFFKSEKKFTDESVKFILKIREKKKLVNIALSGGSTPKPIYKALGEKITAKKLLPAGRQTCLSGRQVSQKIHFYQVDERYIPATHKDSNQKMINENLIQKTGCIFNHFDTSISIKKSLKKYSQQLQKKFDLTVLGIGPDGHIASIFPAPKNTSNYKALTTKTSVAHTTTQKFAVKDRLTLTFPPILKSKNILVLLKGKEKLPIIEKLNKYSPKKSAKKIPKITPAEIQKFPALKLLSHKKIQINFLNNYAR